MRKRILLLEDEQAIADTLLYALQSEGFEVRHVGLAREALLAFEEAPPDLAILDVGVPDGNGFDVCRAIRKTSELPIVFLTARHEEIDRVLGLELGADDYVVKPFSPREVCARVRAILRRSAAGGALAAAPTPAPVATGLLTLDEKRSASPARANCWRSRVTSSCCWPRCCGGHSASSRVPSSWSWSGAVRRTPRSARWTRTSSCCAPNCASGAWWQT